MKTLFNSGIEKAVIDELKAAMQKQLKEEINSLLDEVKKSFIEKGYSEEELTPFMELHNPYEESVYLEVGYITPEGVKGSKSTSSMYLKLSPHNVKELNVVIKKIEDYYNEKREEINKQVYDSLMQEEVPYTVDRYGDIVLNIPYLYNNKELDNPYLPRKERLSGEMLDRVNYHLNKIRAKINAEKEAEKARYLAEKEAKKAALKEWAIKNGSQLLKAYIEEGFDWESLANEEYLKSIIPEGFDFFDEDDYDECEDVTDPSLFEIEQLKEARKNPQLLNVELKRCTSRVDYDNVIIRTFVVGYVESFYKSYTCKVAKLIKEKTIESEIE